MDFQLAAKFLAIPSGFILGSYNAVFSQNVIPHLYKQPASVATPIFSKIFFTGGSTIFPIAMTAIGAYGYLSYVSNPAKRKLYGSAAVLTFATLPLTKLVMMPGINRLIEISRSSSLQTSAGISTEVAALLKTWVAQNYFRASLHLTAGFIGLYAALS